MTYQDHTCEAQQEGNRSIQQQHKRAGLNDVIPREMRHLNGNRDDKVDGGTDGRIVVQTDQRIHIHALAAQHDLNHNHPYRLKHQPTQLEHDAHPREVNLAKPSQSDTEHDEEDVDDVADGRVGDSPEPGRKEDDNGRRGLEHLDKGDG